MWSSELCLLPSEIIDFENPSIFGIFHHFEHGSGVGRYGVFGTNKRRILEWGNAKPRKTTRTNDGKRQRYGDIHTCGWRTTMPTDQTRPTSLRDRAFSGPSISSHSFLPSFLIPFPLNSASLSPRIRCRDLGFTVVLKIASTLSVHSLQMYTQVHIQP